MLKLPIDLIVFGGSFDPPHQGHGDCLRLLMAEFPYAKIVLMLAKKSPTINGHEKQPSSSFFERFEKCKVFFRDLLGEQVKLSSLEETLDSPSYTIQTLVKLSEQNPGQQLGLFMGGDQLASFLQWKNPAMIVRVASLIAVSRQNQVELEHAKNLIESQLNISIHVLSGETTAVSSTDIRKVLHQ